MSVAVKGPSRAAKSRVEPQAPPPSTITGHEGPLALPLAATALLAAMSALPAIRGNVHLLWSFWGAAAALVGFAAVMFVDVRRRSRTLILEIVLRKQHYLQACAHLSILIYWGWYWRQVYISAPLIVAQLFFAYAFDSLLAWCRRDTYTFGFGPFPIIFSTNLFLWFKPDWFYLQFLMIAIGFMGKELVRWSKDGRQTHIFNPSSFTLAIFSIILLATGKTAISWGPDIASSQYFPPHIFLWIFAVTLPAQFLFGTAAMTLPAVATTYIFCAVYHLVTGANFFPEQPIPIAVFLGMHLLFTDPSTSPRTDLGRIMFGVLYGSSVVALAALLTAMKVPNFYDKLLPVPILNLMIQGIDRVVRSDAFKRFDPGAIWGAAMFRQRNIAYMTLWALAFTTMTLATGSRATLLRGDALFSQGETDRAIERYREYIQSNPNDADGHNNLGVALMQAGQFPAAIASLQRAIELNSTSAKTYNNLGVAELRAGKIDEAAATLRHAVELQPASADAQANLGQALMAKGQSGDAVGALQRAVDLQPKDPEAHEKLGVGLLQAGRVPDAISSLQRAVELSPHNASAQENLGVALMRAGRGSEAVAALEQSAALQPDRVETQENLGLALMHERRPADALTAFRRAAALAPDRGEAHSLLGQALLDAGRLDDAAASLRKAIELRPDDADAHYNLAHALTSLGQTQAAIEQLRAALRIRPDWPSAQDALTALTRGL